MAASGPPTQVEAAGSGTYLCRERYGKLDADMNQISLTERAARRITEIMAGEPSGSMLRISVNGGGCSGFQYAFDVEQTRQPDDILVERDGATVLVDQVSLPFLEGSTVDFVDDLIGQSFKIENPHATASCGCGTSFSV
jgi:iron-sulfur cluster assembly accessory protein